MIGWTPWLRDSFFYFLGLYLLAISRNVGWMAIHNVFRTWTHGATGYTVSCLNRLFYTLKTRRGGGLHSQSAYYSLCHDDNFVYFVRGTWLYFDAQYPFSKDIHLVVHLPLHWFPTTTGNCPPTFQLLACIIQTAWGSGIYLWEVVQSGLLVGWISCVIWLIYDLQNHLFNNLNNLTCFNR